MNKPALVATMAGIVVAGDGLSYAGSLLPAFGSSSGNTTNTRELRVDQQGADPAGQNAPSNTSLSDTLDNASRRLFVLQGTVSSPGPDAGPFQIVDILPAREDAGSTRTP